MALISCQECGEQVSDQAVACPNCGAPINVIRSKSRSLAVLFAILLGGVGVHKFYLNRPGWGLLYILFCWTFIPAIVGLIEGLIYLFMTEEDFQKKCGSTKPYVNFHREKYFINKSLTTNRDLMQQARESLKGRWGLAVGGNVIYLILGVLIQAIPRVGWIGGLIIGGPLMLGWAAFFLSLSRRQEAQISQLFDGFQRFTQPLVTYLLMILFILLWTILLVIPGIVAALSYSQTFFILAENPQMESMDGLRKSKAMMRGNRWKLFFLFWRFFGWCLLGILSLGIGFLWIMPYMQTTLARFYDDLMAGGGPPTLEGIVSQPSQP